MNYIWERRKGLATIGILCAGAYFGTKYAISKFLQTQEQAAKDKLIKENIKKRFEKIQQDCSFVVCNSNVQTLSEELEKNIQVKELKEKLNQNRGKQEDEAAKKEKVALWEELKIMSFTRAIVSIYAVVFSVVLTRIQLNLINRFTYRDSVIASENKKKDDEIVRTLSEDMERVYVTLAWHFYNIGVKIIVEKAHAAVSAVIGTVSVKKQITKETFREYLKDIRRNLESEILDPKTRLAQKILFPEIGEEEGTLKNGFNSEFNAHKYLRDPQFKSMLDETRDYLSCPDLYQVLQSTLNIGMEYFMLQIMSQFISQDHSNLNGNQKIQEITGEGDKIAVANIIPMIDRQVSAILAAQTESEFVSLISSNSDLEAFAAIIYSSLN